MVRAWRNFKNIFSRPLFTIIFRPEMLKFHPYSILTGDTMIGFVIFCVFLGVLKQLCLQTQNLGNVQANRFRVLIDLLINTFSKLYVYKQRCLESPKFLNCSPLIIMVTSVKVPRTFFLFNSNDHYILYTPSDTMQQFIHPSWQ